MGLLLRPTWPTHQTLWKEQQTENVKKIGQEILTWNVNPMISSEETKNFIKIINTTQITNP